MSWKQWALVPVQRSMKPALFALLLTMISATAAATVDERFQFLYLATIEGALVDGLTNEETDRILMRDGGKGAYQHFIYACPICMPVLNGLMAYRARPGIFGYKKPPVMGTGLPEDLRKQLAGDDLAIRLKAVNALLARWVERRLQMLNLTPKQRTIWDKRFEDGRQEGMKMLENFRQQGSLKVFAPGFADFKECAVCNAATKRTFMGPK